MQGTQRQPQLLSREQPVMFCGVQLSLSYTPVRPRFTLVCNNYNLEHSESYLTEMKATSTVRGE
jgi:hypothetical protein